MSDRMGRRALIARGLGAAAAAAVPASRSYDGHFVSGDGDTAFLGLLDTSYRMLRPTGDLQSLAMLYSPAWNGFVEGPTWGAWWVQNSYGPSYCGMPFFTEPYLTFLRNAQDLWFSQMGDGRRQGAFGWIAPDGCLCDAAAPGWIVYRQGDGWTDIHDWGIEFTAAGLLLQAEMLLVSRDRAAITHYLPMLERCSAFIETRRDAERNLFLAGPAGNLLAPSYAGYRRPDGTYGMAYLTGLSVTYVAALDRLIEVERLAARNIEADRYTALRDSAREALSALTTDEGYLIKYLDPDGVRHGVFGAPRHGYFEAVCNHDAVAFRVVSDAQARMIYDRMASIDGLRRHGVVITNHPSLDDMYTKPEGLWQFGTWVNGGHWTTCEARMLMADLRMGAYEAATRSLEHILRFARVFRTDNPLVEFGKAVYQPGQPINCVYDTWGAPLGLLRGLFEYLYSADELTLVPHLPDSVTRLEQHFPVQWGSKRIYIATYGSGAVRSATVNGRRLPCTDAERVRLRYADMPEVAHVHVYRDDAAGAYSSRRRVRPRARHAPPDALSQVARFAAAARGNGRPLRIGADSNGSHRFVGSIRTVNLWSGRIDDGSVQAMAHNASASDGAALRAVMRVDLRGWAVGPPERIAGLAVRVEGSLGRHSRTDGQTFEGNGFIEVEDGPSAYPEAPYAVEVWIRPDAAPEGGMRIVDKVTAGIDDGYLLDTYPAGSLRFITEHGHAQWEGKLPVGSWSHVVASCEPEVGLRLYLGGSLIVTAPARPQESDELPLRRIEDFVTSMDRAGLGGRYEAEHGTLIMESVAAIHERMALRARGELPQLPPNSDRAADRSYVDALKRLVAGMERHMEQLRASRDAANIRVCRIWSSTARTPPNTKRRRDRQR